MGGGKAGATESGECRQTLQAGDATPGITGRAGGSHKPGTAGLVLRCGLGTLSRRLDSQSGRFKSFCRYGSSCPEGYGAKREFGEARANAGAAPATVSGEPRSISRHWDRSVPGRPDRSDYPQARRPAVAQIPGRGAPAGCRRVWPLSHGTGSTPASAYAPIGTNGGSVRCRKLCLCLTGLPLAPRCWQKRRCYRR